MDSVDKLAPTIKDVADLANVHYTTASRALRGHPEIHAETALRVRAAAVQLGYVPNVHAQALRNHGGSPVAGIVTDPISTDELSRYSQPFWLAMLMGITRHLAEAGVGAIQVTADALDLLSHVPVRSLLLLSLVNSPPQLPDSLKDVPIVVERSHILAADAAARIGHDHAEIAREACEYLVARGSRRVAYLPLSQFDLLSVAASTGYLSWSQARGQEPVIIDPSTDPAAQQLAVATALNAGVDGIYATTGELAPVMKAIGAAGLACPGDVQVVGIGEGVIERLMDPPVTSINLGGAECAAQIASLLEALVRGRQVTDVVFGHRLIPRGSTR